jgi:hypothetical protein
LSESGEWRVERRRLHRRVAVPEHPEPVQAAVLIASSLIHTTYTAVVPDYEFESMRLAEAASIVENKTLPFPSPPPDTGSTAK